MHSKLLVVRVQDVIRAELGSKVERMKVGMIRWTFDVSLKETQSTYELRRRLGTSGTGDVMRRSRLGWHGHVEGKDDADYVKTCTRLVKVDPRTSTTERNGGP